MKIKHIASPGKKTIFGLSILFFLMIPFIGMIDYSTGPAITFALIYLIPVSAIAWLNDRRGTIVLASSLTAMTWIAVDYFSGRFSLSIIAYSWNFFSRFAILLIVTTTLSALKQSLLDAHHLSRRDPLTNALNKRGFVELAEREIYRATRSGHAITIVFLDVDNFKTINDTFGHSAGDILLATIVKSLRLHTRKSDLIGRVGGDEFVILLPDTGQDAARIIVAKNRGILMEEAGKLNFPVTFSLGVLTCTQPPESVDAMIGMADKLMYKVKTNSKNDIVFSLYPDAR
jgi:diguanylate cyclase (GGDEF)-like protein